MTEYDYHVIFPLWTHEGVAGRPGGERRKKAALEAETRKMIKSFSEQLNAGRAEAGARSVLDRRDLWGRVFQDKEEGEVTPEELDRKVEELAEQRRREELQSKPVYNVLCSVIEHPLDLAIDVNEPNTPVAFCRLTAYGDPEWFPEEFKKFHRHARISRADGDLFKIDL